MIKPLDIQNFDQDKLQEMAERRQDEKDLKALKDEQKGRAVPKTPSKFGLVLGFLLLVFVVGTMGYNMVLSAKVQKPSPTSFIKIENSKLPLPTAASGSSVLDQAKKSSSDILSQLLKTGEKAGAAVLGISVSFMQKTASKEAPLVASAAAHLVLQSAAPAIVQQINKLPPDQKKEVTKLLCK